MARYGREIAKANILASRRKTLHKIQKGFCAYCNEYVILENATVDHRIPISKGGTHSMDNLYMTCYDCNKKKGNQTEKEFRRWLLRCKIHAKNKSNDEKSEI